MTTLKRGRLFSAGIRRLGCVIALIMSGIAGSSATAQEHATQASLVFTSPLGDTVGPGTGKTYAFTTPVYDFSAAIDDQFSRQTTPDALLMVVKNKTTGNTVQFRITAPLASSDPKTQTPLTQGTYICAQDFNVSESTAHVPGINFLASPTQTTPGTSCNPDAIGDRQIGSYTINSISITATKVGQLSLFHLLSLDMSFTAQCTGATLQLKGRVTYHAAPVSGAVAYDPVAAGAVSDFGTCSDGTTGTPGGGSGSGSGGGPTPTAPTIVLPDNILTSPIQMVNSDSATVAFSTFIPTTTTSDVTLTATTDADNLLATITPSVIKPGGSGEAKVTIQTTAATSSGEHIVTLTASDGTVSSSVSIHVTVICDPPLILGIDQPKNVTVGLGRPANLTVKASGSGPLTYQWFSGARGLVNFPLAVGSSPNFTTSAINDTTSYWVRVTNPCGSIDSQTVTVSVAAGAKGSNPRH